jgi:hypothetical protein
LDLYVQIFNDADIGILIDILPYLAFAPERSSGKEGDSG